MATSLIIIKLVHFIFIVYFGGFRQVDDITIHFLILCWLGIWKQQVGLVQTPKKALQRILKRLFYV